MLLCTLLHSAVRAWMPRANTKISLPTAFFHACASASDIRHQSARSQ